MERFHLLRDGPISSSRLQGEENPEVASLERESYANGLGFCSYRELVTAESLSLEEEEENLTSNTLSLDDKMPFLKMLQSVESESSPFPVFAEQNNSFQFLLRLQHQKMQLSGHVTEIEVNSTTQFQGHDPESCLTQHHDVFGPNSPVKSDTEDHHPHQQCVEGVRSECNHETPCSGVCGTPSPAPSILGTQHNRERRKRKRTRPPKNQEEVESQRMTHIAVERNRRRQMNDNLTALRSLMPPSYVQRGDQASIIGGAIDFVKELEQLFQSLEGQKRMREGNKTITAAAAAAQYSNGMCAASSSCSSQPHMQYDNGKEEGLRGEFMAESKSSVGDVQVTVIQNHASLKIDCGRRPGQLVKIILALEELRLTVLHLNITSLETSVHYSFSLKVEDDCKMGSAMEIAGAVQEILSFISS